MALCSGATAELPLQHLEDGRRRLAIQDSPASRIAEQMRLTGRLKPGAGSLHVFAGGILASLGRKIGYMRSTCYLHMHQYVGSSIRRLH